MASATVLVRSGVLGFFRKDRVLPMDGLNSTFACMRRRGRNGNEAAPLREARGRGTATPWHERRAWRASVPLPTSCPTCWNGCKG